VAVDAHHVRQRSDGGPDTLANLVALCDGCHGSVHR
jgi:5-methylcytosine-specific restriction endonuclease McrA